MNSIKEKWMKIWSEFETSHPKLAKWVYQIFYFFVFSKHIFFVFFHMSFLFPINKS